MSLLSWWRKCFWDGRIFHCNTDTDHSWAQGWVTLSHSDPFSSQVVICRHFSMPPLMFQEKTGWCMWDWIRKWLVALGFKLRFHGLTVFCVTLHSKLLHFQVYTLFLRVTEIVKRCEWLVQNINQKACKSQHYKTLVRRCTGVHEDKTAVENWVHSIIQRLRAEQQTVFALLTFTYTHITPQPFEEPFFSTMKDINDSFLFGGHEKLK